MGATGTRQFAPWPAVPANGATVILFTTHPRVPGGGAGSPQAPTLSMNRAIIDAVTITWQRHNKAGAANGLKFYVLDNTDTWRESDVKDNSDAATMPKTVPALAAGAEWRETFVTGYYRGFCIEYTAGADNPEEWNGTIAVDYGQQTVTL